MRLRFSLYRKKLKSSLLARAQLDKIPNFVKVRTRKQEKNRKFMCYGSHAVENAAWPS